MRQNLPVTQREYSFDGRQTLLSTTDPKGRITYANSPFVAVSGFTAEELQGQPHNIVRHPDMPPEAFADMWATIKAGESWTALVKNRRKDGDHYWVRANATPRVRDGQVVGYVSVRTAPTRAEIDAAEALYRRFREGQARGLAFYRGLIVHTGWGAWRSVFQKLSTGARVALAVWGGGPAAGADRGRHGAARRRLGGRGGGGRRGVVGGGGGARLFARTNRAAAGRHPAACAGGGQRFTGRQPASESGR